MIRTKKLFVFYLFAFILLCSQPLWAAATEGGDPSDEQNLVLAAQAMRQAGRVQLNFKDLEMAKFIRFMAELLGENIVVDPAVTGTVSVVSPKPISFKEARQVMLSVLEMNKMSLQDMGGYAKVVPATAGPSTENRVVKSSEAPIPGEQMAVQIVPLDYVKAAYVVDPVKLAVPGLNIAPVGTGNGVVLSGKATLVSRGVRVIQALDAPDSVRAIKTFVLQNGSSKAIEGHFNAIAKDNANKMAGSIAIADERSGRLIVVGTRQALKEAERLLVELDVPQTSGYFHVYRLQNTDAKVMAEQIAKVLAASSGRPAAAGQKQMPSSVVPDLTSNSLILTASPEEFTAIKNVLDKLDIRPKQVLLRGLVAEVNLTRLNNAGIDWGFYGGFVGGDVVTGIQGNLGESGIPATFMEWFKELTQTTEYTKDGQGNMYQDTKTEGKGLVFAAINLLNKHGAMNVLSMPRLLCTDNLESELQVGQVIPTLKGKTSDSTALTATVQTYDYKDTGIILKVTPHIRSGNFVALEIEQTLEELVSMTLDKAPTTSKRHVKTTVLVSNGQTIVIGGLIKELERITKSRVPGFSYIPLLGNLFKTSGKEREKIDLVIFLTPYIIESAEEANRITDMMTSGDRQQLSPAERRVVDEGQKKYDEAIKQNK